MKLIQQTLIIALLCFALTGCQSESADEPMLQVHDVVGIEQKNLEEQLNQLLQREDLALKGRVSLLENDRLAVNGPARLQAQISEILGELRSASRSSASLTDGTYRVRYWLLTMEMGEQTAALPEPLQALLPSLQDEFPGYAIKVGDFMESYHFEPQTRFMNISSGAGSRMTIMSARPTINGLELSFELWARAVYDDQMATRYDVNRLLVDGRPLVLGRTFMVAEEEQPAYQVLLAQADLIDAQD